MERREKVMGHYGMNFTMKNSSYEEELKREFTYKEINNSGIVSQELEYGYDQEFGKSQSYRVYLTLSDVAVVEEFLGDEKK